MRLKLQIALLLFLTQTHSQQFCPALICDDFLGKGVCFMHSGTSPVSFLRFTPCQDQDKLCYLGDDYAWVNAPSQFYGSGKSFQNSQVSMKNTMGSCLSPADFRRDLLPGRFCTYDTQCQSGVCNKIGVCAGRAFNEPCAENSECDINLACIPSKAFPWQTFCRSLLYEGESCEDDFQCGYSQVCSYADSSSAFKNLKTCIQTYSLEDGTQTGFRVLQDDVQKDSLYFGRKCQSGMCRQSSPTECVCSSIANITTNLGSYSAGNAQCTTSSQYNYCQYNYVHDDDGDGIVNLGFIKMPCQCSLDGSVGYCPVPAQTEISSYISSLQLIQTYALGCHSEDRYNLKAQLECGIANQYKTLDDLYSLISVIFNFKFYPFVQTKYSSQTNSCMSRGHPESPLNMIKYAKLVRTQHTNDQTQ